LAGNPKFTAPATATFTDTQNHKFRLYIEWAASAGIVSTSNTNFNPDTVLTRSVAAAFLARHHTQSDRCGDSRDAAPICTWQIPDAINGTSTFNGTINIPKDVDYIKLDVTTSGRYLFTSATPAGSSVDPFGFVSASFDSVWPPTPGSQDKSASTKNFRFESSLTAGTVYWLKFQDSPSFGAGNNTGDYSITVTRLS
jgi:hypothetical protein